MMLPSNRVLVSTRPIDFGKGHDGLAAIVSSVLRKDPFIGTVFVFRARKADRLKLLLWDGTGLVMACKRLEDATFTWSAIKAGVKTLAEVDAEKETHAAKADSRATKPAPKRTIGKAAFHQKPIVDRMAKHLKRSSRLFKGETTAPVLDPGRGATKTGYLWALARDDRPWGGEDPPGVVYLYAPGRAGENAETVLTGFDGILQTEEGQQTVRGTVCPTRGYTGNSRLTKPARKGGAPIRVAHCRAHARRKLKEVFDRDGSEIAAVRHCA